MKSGSKRSKTKSVDLGKLAKIAAHCGVEEGDREATRVIIKNKRLMEQIHRGLEHERNGEFSRVSPDD